MIAVYELMGAQGFQRARTGRRGTIVGYAHRFMVCVRWDGGRESVVAGHDLEMAA